MLVGATVACQSSILSAASQSRNSSRGVKIVPVHGVRYPEGFLRFIEGKHFQSPRAAIMAVRNQRFPFNLELVNSP